MATRNNAFYKALKNIDNYNMHVVNIDYLFSNYDLTNEKDVYYWESEYNTHYLWKNGKMIARFIDKNRRQQ